MHLSRYPLKHEIQALLELPHGKAQEVLIANGFWDWSQDPDYDQYVLHFNATCYHPETEEAEWTEGYGFVWATSEVHARSMIEDLKPTDIKWELDDEQYVEDIDSQNVEFVGIALREETD